MSDPTEGQGPEGGNSNPIDGSQAPRAQAEGSAQPGRPEIGEAKRTPRRKREKTPAWRRARFVRAYIANGGNATRAAVVAGYSPKGAGQKGYSLLQEEGVQDEIAKGQAAEINADDLTVTATIREIARIAMSDGRSFFDDQGRMLLPGEWSAAMGAAVSSVESEELYEGKGKHRKLVGHIRKLKLWPKAEALAMASKYHGIFEANNRQMAGNQRRSLEIVFVPSPNQPQVSEERYKIPARFKRQDSMQVTEIVGDKPKPKG